VSMGRHCAHRLPTGIKRQQHAARLCGAARLFSMVQAIMAQRWQQNGATDGLGRQGWAGGGGWETGRMSDQRAGGMWRDGGRQGGRRRAVAALAMHYGAHTAEHGMAARGRAAQPPPARGHLGVNARTPSWHAGWRSRARRLLFCGAGAPRTCGWQGLPGAACTVSSPLAAGARSPSLTTNISNWHHAPGTACLFLRGICTCLLPHLPCHLSALLPAHLFIPSTAHLSLAPHTFPHTFCLTLTFLHTTHIPHTPTTPSGCACTCLLHDLPFHSFS